MDKNKRLLLPKDYKCKNQVKEIGLMYMPDIKPESASVWLRRQIKICTELEEELKKTGWQSQRHSFTPQQLQLVVDHLGPFW